VTNDVFVSYAREDQEFAKRLAAAFERPPRGWSVWWDAELTTGERFNNEIRQAVADSRCLVVLWSPHSVTSDWVVAEAEVARERGILVPVLIGECQIPMPFGTLHCADLRHWKGSESAPEWGDLLGAVQAAFARGPAVSEAEAAARHARVRLIERQRALRKLGVGVAAAVVLGLGWFFNGHLAARGAANRLADVSIALREEVLATDTDQVWWWRLFDNQSTLDKLDASFLIAVEAMRKSPTAKARAALYDAYALLPWSEHLVEIADTYEARALKFNAAGTRAVSAGGVGDTLVWNVADAEILASIPHGRIGDEDWIRNLGWGSLDGSQMADIHDDLIATAGPDNRVALWKTDGSAVRTLEHNGITLIVEFSPDGAVLAAADASGELRLWATATGELLQTWPHENTRGSVVYSADGDWLASAGDDGSVVVWDTRSGTELMRTHDENQERPGVIFVPGRKQILTYGTGAAVWDIESGTLQQRFAEEDEVNSAVFDRDATTLVLGGNTGLEWWNVASGQRLFSRDVEYSLRIVADDDRDTFLTMSSGDNDVQAWDFATGRLLRRMPYAKFPHAFAIDPAGKWLAVSGADWIAGKDVLEFASIRPDNLVTDACKLASRNLTEEEWDQHLGDEPYRRTCENLE
jgi:WD40 repeat protein